MNVGPSSWSPERVDRMVALHADGFSASQIAAELGGGLTRNAVIGRLSRMGVRRIGAPRASEARQKPSAPRAQPLPKLPPRKDATPANVDVSPAPQERPERPVHASPARGEGVALVDLRPGHCRFIPGQVAGARTMFCGAGVVPGKSWCPACLERVFDRSRVRGRAAA